MHLILHSTQISALEGIFFFLPRHGNLLGCHPCCNEQWVRQELALWSHQHQQRLQLSQRFREAFLSGLLVEDDSDGDRYDPYVVLADISNSYQGDNKARRITK